MYIPPRLLPGLLMLLTASSSFAPAQDKEEFPPKFPNSFSADATITRGSQQQRVKFDKLEKMTRMEMEVNGERIVNIIDSEKNQIITMQVENKNAIRMTNPIISKDPMNELAAGNLDLLKVGEETVNKVKATKYETKTDFGQTIYVWFDKDNTPVRLATDSGGVQIDFEKVSLVPPKKEIFELPTGYTIRDIDPTKPGGGVSQPAPSPAKPE